MKYLVLMYADPTATEAMTAAERAEVFRRHEALHEDLEGTGEMLNGAGPAFPRDSAWKTFCATVCLPSACAACYQAAGSCERQSSVPTGPSFSSPAGAGHVSSTARSVFASAGSCRRPT